MADGTLLNVGTGGDTIATEDIAGVKHELVKLVDATAGSTTRTGIAANPLRTDPTGATTQPVSLASAPSTPVTAVATEAAPAYTEAQLAAFSQDLAGNLRTRSSALVSDALQTYLTGTVRPLSITNDGSLRVAVIPFANSVSFFSKEQEDAWGDLQPDFSFSGSPWGEW